MGATAMTTEDLTTVQKQMLTGAFYIDSHHNADYLGEADDLVERGLLTRTTGGDSQYTSYHYTPVKP
ncbi:hypothetical protein CcrColossus_gp200 [Caulobacter phage CcrColossus]|uniref:Uncharacterized protein n=1 Tax=Caulobacter phage CcrColossus TaxID=1211640 RepID=K4JUP2_9CAUD|nr:hypothetical protein CcrColossus_gp200 [Caulobacter phage CcrColossus]AFU88070.1 hypothetical protein CcrColossus_gp200 [Caulobacter phage CcrColossus]